MTEATPSEKPARAETRNPFKTALRAAYAQKSGLIIACNRAYRRAFSEGDTIRTELFRRELWKLLREGGFAK